MSKSSLVFYSFSTQNTKRFANRVKHESTIEITESNPFIKVDNPFIIVIPSYEPHVFPEIYDIFEDFFETGDNIENCKGIFASGNRNFMSLFGITGKTFSKKYNIPILHEFEFQGDRFDINKIKEELKKIG